MRSATTAAHATIPQSTSRPICGRLALMMRGPARAAMSAASPQVSGTQLNSPEPRTLLIPP